MCCTMNGHFDLQIPTIFNSQHPARKNVSPNQSSKEAMLTQRSIQGPWWGSTIPVMMKIIEANQPPSYGDHIAILRQIFSVIVFFEGVEPLEGVKRVNRNDVENRHLNHAQNHFVSALNSPLFLPPFPTTISPKAVSSRPPPSLK